MVERNLFGNTLPKGDAKLMNPQVLAFIGDAVHTLAVRTYLALHHTSKSGDLHKRASHIVNARAQSKRIETIYESLTEEEKEMFRRGRNVKVNNIAKHAGINEYKKSTGYECLIGYLYLTGQYDRIESLVDYSEEEPKS